jgi:hypothetical protein
MRDNVRTFTISDSFGKLIAPANDDYFDFPQLGVDIEGSVSTFTTTISAGLTPKAAFSPVGQAWQTRYHTDIEQYAVRQA